MTLVVEDGSGVGGATSYVTSAFVDAYLGSRNRQDENSWSAASAAEKEGAIVRATDYVETRFSERFKGVKEHGDVGAARAVLTLTSNPADTETVTLGSVTYTFNTVVGGANSVLIGANPEASLDNLIAAVNASGTEGTEYGAGTVQNADVEAATFYGQAMLAKARAAGEAGNALAATETLAGGSWSFATLNGGNDYNLPQPLSFPRASLYDRDGLLVQGVPARLQQAVAEYAVRAISGSVTLLPDPQLDDTGRAVRSVREKVGPIETETVYSDDVGITNLMRSYPAADRLLSPYLLSSGRAIRG